MDRTEQFIASLEGMAANFKDSRNKYANKYKDEAEKSSYTSATAIFLEVLLEAEAGLRECKNLLEEVRGKQALGFQGSELSKALLEYAEGRKSFLVSMITRKYIGCNSGYRFVNYRGASAISKAWRSVPEDHNLYTLTMALADGQDIPHVEREFWEFEIE